MNMNIDEKDFDFYSGFCHFIRCKENNPIKWCTHFDGPAECNMEKCPLIKQRLRERGEE